MNFGRWEDPESVARFFGTQPKLSGDALTGADDNADVDLCAIYTQVTGRTWNSRNQNPRGFCVGFGNAKAATLSIAMMAAAKEIDWPGNDVAIEPIYGGMRYEIGAKTHGSDLNRGGDGGVGSWAAEWLLKYGVLLMQPYLGSIDFSSYSEKRCDQYGRNGVPDELEPIAKEHPLTQASLCNTGQDIWRLLGQMHPVVHCSNQGFTMTRDSMGRIRPSGSWAHCWDWVARHTLKGNPYVKGDNSWDGDEDGNGYMGGPITVEGDNGPIHLNGNQALVELDVAERMAVKGGETFAFTGPKGFNKRRELFLI